MAVPTFHKIRMFPEASGTTAIFNTPEGASAGDTLQIGIVVAAVVTISVAGGGWTQLFTGEGPQASETYALFQLPNWNGTTTSYTVEYGGASKFCNGAIAAYSGTDKLTPHNALGTAKKAEAKEAEILAPTTTNKECLLVAWVFNGSGFTANPASGWTEDGDQAAGPEISHKNVGVEPGAQTAIKIVLNNTTKYISFMVALQPQQKGFPFATRTSRNILLRR